MGFLDAVCTTAQICRNLSTQVRDPRLQIGFDGAAKIGFELYAGFVLAPNAVKAIRDRYGEEVLGAHGVVGYFSTWKVKDFLHSQWDHVRHEDTLHAIHVWLSVQYMDKLYTRSHIDIDADTYQNFVDVRNIAHLRGHASEPRDPKPYVSDFLCDSSGRRFFGGDGPDYPARYQFLYDHDENVRAVLAEEAAEARRVEAQERAQREAELEQPVVPWFN